MQKPQIATAIFDMGVLFGVSSAALLAQTAAKATGCATLKVDGHIGPQTIAGLNAVNPRDWMDAYIPLFKIRAAGIIERKPEQVKFKDGWDARISRLKTLL